MSPLSCLKEINPHSFGIPPSLSQEVVKFNIQVPVEVKQDHDKSCSDKDSVNQPQDYITLEEVKNEETTSSSIKADENKIVVPKSKKEPPIHALLEKSMQIKTLENLSEKAAKQAEFLIMKMEDPKFKDRILSLSAQGEDLIQNGLNVLVKLIMAQIKVRAN